MAKQIIGGIGSLLGLKKKKAAPVAAAEKKGPIITQLAPGTTAPNMRRQIMNAQTAPTLADKLGSIGKLGG